MIIDIINIDEYQLGGSNWYALILYQAEFRYIIL